MDVKEALSRIANNPNVNPAFAAALGRSANPHVFTKEGDLARAKGRLDPLVIDQALAALIDAEDLLYGFIDMADDTPRPLVSTIYKVRTAILALEDPEHRVSRRVVLSD